MVQHLSEAGSYDENVPYCFCMLAFGAPYRLAAKEFSQQLQKYGVELIVATDQPDDFADSPGVVAIKFHRRSILYPYNDKRFALAAALEHYECAVLVDADSTIEGELPKYLHVPPGMYAAVAYKSLEETLNLYYAHNFKAWQKLAGRFKIDLKKTQWVSENLVIVRRDQGREKDFLELWAVADRWLGIRRKFQVDAAYIGVAAAKVGWKVYRHDDFKKMRANISHNGHKSIGIQGRAGQSGNAISKRFNFYRRWLLAVLCTLYQPQKYWL
ncbi:MAG: hypothetical protein HC800_20380 [Phormidesmis sp. RL_2_1]|nr:hypothetical protein [Phormidesmis sp. RL_2_1]